MREITSCAAPLGSSINYATIYVGLLGVRKITRGENSHIRALYIYPLLLILFPLQCLVKFGVSCIIHCLCKILKDT
jgi:hypothetical protein